MIQMRYDSTDVAFSCSGARHMVQGLHHWLQLPKRKKKGGCTIMAANMCLYGRQGMFVEQLNSS
jgi:hypothetical protein